MKGKPSPFMPHSQLTQPIKLLAPGMIAWAHTWPDWERGQECPHPVLAFGFDQNGFLGVFPCSSKNELAKHFVSISKKDKNAPNYCDSAFVPIGNLDNDPTWVCLSDKRGRLNLRWVKVEPNAIVGDKGTIRLKRIIALSPADWKKLYLRIAIEIRNSKEHRS